MTLAYWPASGAAREIPIVNGAKEGSRWGSAPPPCLPSLTVTLFSRDVSRSPRLTIGGQVSFPNGANTSFRDHGQFEGAEPLPIVHLYMRQYMWHGAQQIPRPSLAVHTHRKHHENPTHPYGRPCYDTNDATFRGTFRDITRTLRGHYAGIAQGHTHITRTLRDITRTLRARFAGFAPGHTHISRTFHAHFTHISRRDFVS